MKSINWQPTASLINLKKRAQWIASIRAFFAERRILEVETPLLSQHTVTDPHIQSFVTEFIAPPLSKKFHLQTSPEYAMKRLLANGSGPIYQICKAFRNGEVGAQHNPEFTMLEWYRPSFTHHDLMQEVDELIQTILQTKSAERCSYQNLFLTHLEFDPFTISTTELQKYVQHHCHYKNKLTHDDALNLLLAHCIEPTLGQTRPIFIYDFPVSQSALARIRNDTPPVAERFELYFKGKEMANGFCELTNADEQFARFQHDQNTRQRLQRPIPEIDLRLISALRAGFPECAGVALGIDRLMMLALEASHIKEVITFNFDTA